MSRQAPETEYHHVKPAFWKQFIARSMAAALLSCIAMESSATDAPTPDSATFFEQHIRPILASQCVECHGESKQKNGLRLDSREAMLAGGETGPAFVAGNAAESLLLRAVRHQDGLEMPPDKSLPERDIAFLEAWITAGAPWPEHAVEIRPTASEISDTDRAWWAFQPLAEPEVPALEGDTWPRNAIDHFVRQRQREVDIEPAPEAEKAVLIRRLYFDLVGMPPTPDQVDRFVKDASPDAWERLVDRLLDDPRHGERWARFWLDLVRYAESDGWNKDSYRPDIWRYRDYVVDAFNADKPYTDFVREQLAGDEMPGDDPEHLTATGYLRQTIYEYNQRDAKGHWDSIMNEITDVTGNVFFGLSMSCSRCHDHKFDPIPQTDYFSLRAFFEPIVWKDGLPAATEAEQAAWRDEQTQWETASTEIRARIDALKQPYIDKHEEFICGKFPLEIQACYRKPEAERNSWEAQMAYLVARQCIEESGGPFAAMSNEDKAALEGMEAELAAHDALKPAPLPTVMAAADHPGSLSPTVMPGDSGQTPVAPQFLAVLAGNPVDRQPQLPEVAASSGRRTALAAWIGRSENPLTTRVIVNRIWQQHFGEGIVTSANDFGHLGQPPTHPELLDWLTSEFVNNGWRFKHLHRLIVNSATWRQSALHPDAAAMQAKDPAEVLLWRARVRRLNAEELRDSMLAASGELDERIGGPSVSADAPRRGLYVKRMRNTPDALLAAFDAADGLTSVSQRNTTTTPTQALLMINGDYALVRAARLADRILAAEFQSREEALDFAFRTAWGRAPCDAERHRVLGFVGRGDPAKMERDRLVDFCHVLFNSNAFMYVD